MQQRLFLSAATLSTLTVLAVGSVDPDDFKTARFELVGTNVTSDCSVLFDHCVRATCEVKNVGQADGVAVVEFEADGTSFTKRAEETVFVPAGQTVTVAHDFPEAKLLDETRVRCRASRGD